MSIGKSESGITRRGLLGAGGAAVALAAGGAPLNALAQANGTVEILFTNQAVSGPLKTAIESGAGCTLNDQPFQSSTDVVSRLIAPGSGARYDVMGSTMEFSRVPVLGERAGQEKVQAFDLAQIPNFGQIDPAFKGQIGERDGKVYMIPICLGYDSMVYNREKVPEEDTQSWSLIFEDKYAGRIGWFDVAHQMIMAAGLYLGNPEPEKMDNKQLDEVIKFLIAKKKNVRAMWTTFAQGASLMASGEIVCSYTAVPMRVDLQLKGFNVAGAWPKEGVVSVTLACYMPKEARNVKGAHAVVNAMLGESYASQLTKQSGYLPTSKLGAAAMASMDRKISGFGVLDGTTKNHGLNFPPNITAWIEGWSRVKSA